MAEQFGTNPWPSSPSTESQPDASSLATRPAYELADVTTKPLRQSRTWPAVVTLYLMAPITGEVLCGATPPLQLLTPVTFLFLTGLYGSGAIIVRELVRRRGLGWQSLLLFGLAYGILEEGLVVTSWFNPYWPDLGFLASYGRLLDTSWVWATELTIYHAVISISAPVLLTETIFPRIANRPWLGKRGFRVAVICLTIVSFLEMLLFAFLVYRSKGYSHPPLMYFGALLLAIGLVIWGLRLRPLQASIDASRPAPRLWLLRGLGFGGVFALFFGSWVLPHLQPFPIVPIIFILALLAAGVWLMSRWTKRTGWGMAHRLAFVSGLLSFLIALSPLAEFVIHPAGRNTTGMTAFDLLFLLGLIVLALRRPPAGDEAARLTPVAGMAP